MGHGDPHRLHPGDHGRGGRSAGGHHLDGVIQPPLERRVGIVEHIEHDGRRAEVAHLVLVQRAINGGRLHMAQADAHPGGGRQRPGEAPAVAVKHRQSPEIDRVFGQLPGEHIVDGVEVSTAMVIDHPFGIAGGARGVVERNSLPLIFWQPARLIATPLRKELFIVKVTDKRPLAVEGIVDSDDQRLVLQQLQRLAHHKAKLPVHQHHLALGMLEDKGHRLGIEPGIDGVEHRAAHRHPEVRLKHRRDIGRNDGDCIPLPDTAKPQGRGKLAATAGGLAPALAQRAVDQRRIVGIDPLRPPQKADGGQGLEIGGSFGKVALIDVLLCHRIPSSQVAQNGQFRDQRAIWASCPSLVSYGDDSLTVSLRRQVLAKRLRGAASCQRGDLF